MRNHRKQITHYIFYGLILLSAVMVFYVGAQRHMRVNFTHERLFNLDKGWLYITLDGTKTTVDLPTILDTQGAHTAVLTHKLPSATEHYNAVGILTDNQDLTVYVNGLQIYSRKSISHQDKFFNLPSGAIWDIVSLPPSSEGKTITLVFESKYEDAVGKIHDIHVGTKASILLHNAKTYGNGFILSILIFVLAIIMLTFYVLIRRLIDINRSIYYLGWFFFLSSVWLLMESNMTQLFISNADIISALGYLSLLTMPFPLLFHIQEQEFIHHSKMIGALINLLFLCDFILFHLQIFNIADFHETLFIYQSIVLTVFMITLATLYLELIKYKKKMLSTFTIASTILFIFSLLELFTYKLKLLKDIGIFFRIGLYLFLLILTIDAINRTIDIIKLSKTASHYKLLATRDPLTNCRNRARYMSDMENMDLSRNATIFMADMNNMKEINDTYGHHAGDEAVILCSHCLMKIFGHRVYRIGGDEFLCIGYNLSVGEIKYNLDVLTQECERVNEDNPYKFGISIGYATYDKELDQSIYDTVKRADAMMYQNKEKMKALSKHDKGRDLMKKPLSKQSKRTKTTVKASDEKKRDCETKSVK